MTAFFSRKNRALDIALIVIIVIGLCVSGYFIADRIADETADDTVTTLTDWTQISDMARQNGKTAEEFLLMLPQRDGKPLLTGISIHEPNYKEYVDNMLLTMYTSTEVKEKVLLGEWQTTAPTKPDTYFIAVNAELQEQIYLNLLRKTNSAVRKETIKTQSGAELLAVITSTTPLELERTGLGFYEPNLKLLKDLGFDIVLFVRSWYRFDEVALNQIFDPLKKFTDNYPVTALAFSDKVLPGFFFFEDKQEQITEQTAQYVSSLGIPVVTMEFFAQTGLRKLLETDEINFNAVRFHTLMEYEVGRLDDVDLKYRYKLAVSERNLRLANFRFDTRLSAEDNFATMNHIIDGVLDAGKKLGTFTTLKPHTIPYWAIIIIALAIYAGGILLLKVMKLEVLCIWLLILGILGVVGLAVLDQKLLLTQVLGLLAVIIFPTLSVSYFVSDKPRSILMSVFTLLVMSLCSLMGAVLMSGMLSSKNFMIQSIQFTGIKAGMFAPMACLLWIFFYRYIIESRKKFELAPLAIEAVKININVGIAALAAVALVAVVVLFVRSGNDATLSSFEKTFRDITYRAMSVRPRTKEFLIGMPLMMLVLYYGKRHFMWLAAVAGAVGQVSIVNTFEHLHTPFLISVIRTFNGLLLGIPLGIVLILVSKPVIKLFNKTIMPYVKKNA